MRRLLKTALLLFLLVLFFFSRPAFAQDSNFSTFYDVTYSVLDSGTTHTAIDIKLVNKSSQFYASSYKMSVGFGNISNIKASDEGGEIIPVVSKTNGANTIELTFNKRVVGLGNPLPFTVSFDTDEIVQKEGNIWEIDIPGVENGNNFENFNAHVRVPTFLGKPTFIKPEQPTQSLDFTKEQLGKSGISLAFGEKQNYGFSLAYHLKNTYAFPVKTEIALPPSTNYQTVLIDSIEPKPLNVTVDKDGNWLAEYSLLPTQKKDILVKGKASLSLFPKKEVLSDNDLSDYLKEKPYWEISNAKIKETAKNITTPKEIYDYVVKTLTYDFSRVSSDKKRVGAAALLDNPSSAVCLEFTDLFITLARASGIPAREVDGYAYTQNSKERPLSLVKDILHSWPEYYDKERQTWIMVDPTWGNTTSGVDYFNVLDFDHFAFVVKGEDSTYPVPAGGYKLTGNENTKDVDVSFSEEFEQDIPGALIEEHFPNEIPSFFPIDGFITIKNTSTAEYPNGFFEVSSESLSPKFQKMYFGKIPPFGFLQIPVSFERTPLLTNQVSEAKIAFLEKTDSYKIKIFPIIFSPWALVGGIVFVLFIFIISFIARNFRRLPFFRLEKQSPLRGESEEP